jgi:hypothetical protein
METTVGDGDTDRVMLAMTGTVRVEDALAVGDVEVLSGSLAFGPAAVVEMARLTVTGRLEVGQADLACDELTIDGGLVTVDGGSLRVEQGSLASIVAQIEAARGPGDWSGTTGIGSAHAAADPGLVTVFASSDATGVLVAATIFGDTDLNGTVGREDFVALRANMGQPGALADGDVTQDGEVDYLDYVLIKRNAGQSFSGQAEVVPEPATLALLAIGGAAALLRRKRR